MDEQTWVISTKDLQIGTVLSFDLLDATGNVLHKAGMPISERLKERLHSNGIDSVSIRGRSEAAPDQINSVLAESFDPALLKELTQTIKSTQSLVQNSISLLLQNKPLDGRVLEAGSERFVECASKDVAAALSTLVTTEGAADAETIEAMSLRASRLSLLSVSTALTQGQSESFAISVGLAALLHDSSLALAPKLYEKAFQGNLSAQEIEQYRNHPMDSMDLLRRSPGISERMLEIISQVHEQADGSGYPLGLRISETKYEASILNAADTYLALTDSRYHKRFVHSDALLYLIANASRGRYCPKAVQAMIKSMSVFPIGSVVILDDDSKAVVIRSNSDAPAKPIVRLLSSGHTRVDLQESKRTIVAPFVDPLSGYHRLPKSEMSNLLWGLPVAA
jgi:response regulator RpfG family c-di-GMP phosphodiesterase